MAHLLGDGHAGATAEGEEPAAKWAEAAERPQAILIGLEDHLQ